jgi:8-oxo-dGTP pyrophosphatase MutT (NUDIX family)
MRYDAVVIGGGTAGLTMEPLTGDLAPGVLARAEALYGRPHEIRVVQEIAPAEIAMVRSSQKGGLRAHDVTLYIWAAGAPKKLAVIAKHSYPPGAFRPPGGAVHAGEELAEGAAREALEETGLVVTVERYLLRVAARFTCAGQGDVEWRTHVVGARAAGGTDRLRPLDTREIREARWSTLDEVQGPIRAVLLETGRGLFAYRVALHDAVAALLRG